MAVLSSVGGVLGAVALLALLGFVVVVLAGPVLAIIVSLVTLILSLVASALPFALIGLLVWGTYQLVTRGPRGAWRDLGLRVAQIGYWLLAVPLIGIIRVVKGGLRAGRAVTALALPAARRAGQAAKEGVEAGAAMGQRGAAAAGATVSRVRPVGRFSG